MSNWLLSKLIEQHDIAYLLVDENFSITYASAKIDGWINVDPEELDGSSALAYLPELVGIEDTIRNLKNHQQGFRLQSIERAAPDGQTRYYDLYIEAMPAFNEGYMILLSDVSETTQLMQQFATQRNELRLLAARLEDANQKITYLLKQFVPEKEAEALISQQKLPTKEQETRREATLLIANLHNLTRLVQALPMNQALDMLDGCMLDIEGVINQHGGTLIQLDGNLLTISFNLPQALPDHAWYAAQAALEAQCKLAERFSWWRQGEQLHLGFGFGLASGWVAGVYLSIGQRCQYSLIGDASVAAFQLAAQAAAGHVLINQAAVDQLGKRAQVIALDTLPNQTNTAYRLISLKNT